MSKINNKNSTIKRVLLQIRPYLPTIILLLALAVVSVLCSLYIPVLVGDAIDAIIGKEQVNFAVILPSSSPAPVLIGCAALAQWLMNVCGNKVTYNTIRDMREAAFKKIHRLPFSYLDAHETGDIVSRIIADVDQFADGLLMGFSQLFIRRCDRSSAPSASCFPSTFGQRLSWCLSRRFPFWWRASSQRKRSPCSAYSPKHAAARRHSSMR